MTASNTWCTAWERKGHSKDRVVGTKGITSVCSRLLPSLEIQWGFSSGFQNCWDLVILFSLIFFCPWMGIPTTLSFVWNTVVFWKQTICFLVLQDLMWGRIFPLNEWYSKCNHTQPRKFRCEIENSELMRQRWDWWDFN
jgi:hypothetical protein